MIFTFWVHDSALDGDAQDGPEAVAAWREHYPGTSLYSDSDVLPILAGFGSTCVDLYGRIRIPACKSDLARLLLLFRFGGLYVDSHTGPGNAHHLVNVFAALAAYEVVLFDKIWEHKHMNDIYIMNSVMCARQSSPVIKHLIDSALHNLQEHERKEHEAEAYVPYNIFVLTGAWDIRRNFFEMRNRKHVIKPAFADRVQLVGIERDQDPGFALYKYYGYRKEGRHWSERQASEPLFLPR
jgi:hypothetical protein